MIQSVQRPRHEAVAELDGLMAELGLLRVLWLCLAGQIRRPKRRAEARPLHPPDSGPGVAALPDLGRLDNHLRADLGLPPRYDRPRLPLVVPHPGL